MRFAALTVFWCALAPLAWEQSPASFEEYPFSIPAIRNLRELPVQAPR